MPDTLYGGDFHAWTQEQARRLRESRPNAVDWETIAGELEGMGAGQRSQIETRLYQLLFHLAKLAYAPEPWPRRGWTLSVAEQRARIALLVSKSGSLKGHPAAALPEVWPLARRKAAIALRRPIEDIPAECPFDLDTEVLNPDWFPAGPAGTEG